MTQKYPYFKRKFYVLLLSALLLPMSFIAKSATAEKKDSFNPELIAEPVKLLSSPNEESVSTAIRSISKYGEKAIPALAVATLRANSSYRVNFIRTLAVIGGDAAEKTAANIMCDETNPKAITKFESFVKEEWPELSSRQLVSIATDPNYSQKQRAMAASYIRIIGDPKSVDTLLDILQTCLVSGKPANAGMELNVTNREHVGNIDYSHDMQISSGNKTMTVPVKVTMPVFKTAQAKTKVVVTAQEALTIITGQQFGMDIAKWRQWWDLNRDMLGILKTDDKKTARDK